MKNLEIRIQKENENLYQYKDNLTNVITFLRHPEDKIIVKNGEMVNIEIIQNGETIFCGDKYELFEKLKS